MVNLDMAKSKTRRKIESSHRTGISWGGRATSGSRKWNYVIVISVILALAYGAFAWSIGTVSERDFLSLAESGKEALKQVKSLPSDGRRHLDPGETYVYRSRLPTSGPHSLTWVPPGVYEEAPVPTEVVHALEHGNVLINFDIPGAEVMKTLKAWAKLYNKQWSGLVIAPLPGLGQKVILRAWTNRLDLEIFDAGSAAAFVDAYRGRGPEHPVR